MVDHNNMQPPPVFVEAEAVNAPMVQGYAFAGAFAEACRAVIQQHQLDLQFCQVYALNRNTSFVLINGNMGMFIDTIARFSAIPAHLFGINAAQLDVLLQPPIRAYCGGPLHLDQIAVLAYAGHRPLGAGRVFAQWAEQIEVVQIQGQLADTALETYATLGAILAEGIGIEMNLTAEIERLTIANALACPILNPPTVG